MLLERLPEVQSLSVEDKWRLIDELWSDLAQEGEHKNPGASPRGANLGKTLSAG
jgi:hypothetical protein